MTVVRAVVFDFFGTLTDPSAETLRRAAFDATAAELGIPADVFWAVRWRLGPSTGSPPSGPRPTAGCGNYLALK